MTPLLPELEALPAGLVLDGELVALRQGRPHFPLVCRRLLERDAAVPLLYAVFDLLALDGEPTTRGRTASGGPCSTGSRSDGSRGS